MYRQSILCIKLCFLAAHVTVSYQPCMCIVDSTTSNPSTVESTTSATEESTLLATLETDDLNFG